MHSRLKAVRRLLRNRMQTTDFLLYICIPHTVFSTSCRHDFTSPHLCRAYKFVTGQEQNWQIICVIQHCIYIGHGRSQLTNRTTRLIGISTGSQCQTQPYIQHGRGVDLLHIIVEYSEILAVVSVVECLSITSIVAPMIALSPFGNILLGTAATTTPGSSSRFRYSVLHNTAYIMHTHVLFTADADTSSD